MSRRPGRTPTLPITSLLPLTAEIALAGAKPILRSSPELAAGLDAAEVTVLDLTENPSGAYKISAAALQFAAVVGAVPIAGEGWLLDEARHEAAGLRGKAEAVASSTGNFAAAVARLATFHRIPVEIYMPWKEEVPPEKLSLVETLGAGFARAAHVDSPFFDDAKKAAEEAARHTGSALLQPYDSPGAILGNAASVLLAAMSGHIGDYDLVVVPNGGGGLSAGIFLALESISVRVGERVCAEPGASASFTAADEQQKPVLVKGGKSLASGANVKQHGALTWEILSTFAPAPCASTELEIACGMVLARYLTGQVWEGAAALSLVPLLRGQGRGKRVLVVRSGANPSAKETTDAEALVAQAGGLEALVASLRRCAS